MSPDDKGALQVTDTSYTLHADDADTTGTEYTYDPAGGVALNFTNTYAPDPVSVLLVGTKTLENDALVAGEFSFCLASVSVDGTMYDESNSASLPAGTPMPTLNAGTGKRADTGQSSAAW